jgi:hypothetical protein
MRLLVTAALFIATLCGCGQRVVVWNGSATLGDSAIAFPSSETIRALGPGRLICVSGAVDSTLGKKPPQLDVYLVQRNGSRERVGWRPDTSIDGPSSALVSFPDSLRTVHTPARVVVYPPSPPDMREREGLLCAVDWHGPQLFTGYNAVEIRSNVKLRITEIRWLTEWPSL